MTDSGAWRDAPQRLSAIWVSVAPIKRRSPVGAVVSVFPLCEVFTVAGWSDVARGRVRVRHTETGREFVTKAWCLREGVKRGGDGVGEVGR
jgi:hypothetical protein